MPGFAQLQRKKSSSYFGSGAEKKCKITYPDRNLLYVLYNTWMISWDKSTKKILLIMDKV